MCGIVGIFEYGHRAGGVDDTLLARMRETLHHRGPDEGDSWVSEDRRIGLGHRRLSILDLGSGHQPMHGSGGEVLVFNGEIYNYPQLRAELEREGVRFRTTCDTEVILHLYAKYGESCIDHLNGMFAFALWDPREQQLLFARDRLGEKPFHWTVVNGTLIFGSEIKAILEHPLVTREVNRDQIGPYLTNLISSAPDTLFAGIHKLPPGVMGICTRDGVRTKRYWDVFEPRTWDDVEFEEAAGEVRRLLERSVNDRLLSDVPVGVLLSGGLDSTILVALLRERAAGLATFSVGYQAESELVYDERDEARRVAAEFHTDHHEIIVTEHTLISGLPALIHHQDEPISDPVSFPLHYVCGLAREHGVKVVLGGEGSDELFWGYTTYQRILRHERLMRAVMRLPGVARRGMLRVSPSAGRFATPYELLSGLAKGRALPMHFPGGVMRTARKELLADPTDVLREGWTPSTGAEVDAEDLLDRLGFDTQEHEFGLRLPELLLQRLDRFSMANSVEARVPFLDPDLVSFVYRLPPSSKIRDGVQKSVLRRAVADVVPRWVLEREKQGFAAPVEMWIDSRVGTLLNQLLDDGSLSRYFDVNAVRRAINSPERRRSRKLYLWPILNFALWHKHWIEEAPLEPILESVVA